MRLSLWLLVVLTMSRIASAQQITSPEPRVPDILSRMESKDMSSRQAAFDDMMSLVSDERNQAQQSSKAEVLSAFFARHPDQADSVKLGLIKLLSIENNGFALAKDPAVGTHTEEDGEYYAEVIDTVSSLDDARAIPALVGAITTGGMAKRGLLKYGDKALGPVLEQLKNPDALVRAAALGVSVMLLENRDDPGSHQQALGIIRSGLTDSASVVRGHAVREVDCLRDRQDFLPILQKIAKSDPEKFSGKALDGGDGEEFYPVRYDARQVLRDIQANKSCTP